MRKKQSASCGTITQNILINNKNDKNKRNSKTKKVVLWATKISAGIWRIIFVLSLILLTFSSRVLATKAAPFHSHLTSEYVSFRCQEDM